jgi:hypothetical protein
VLLKRTKKSLVLGAITVDAAHGQDSNFFQCISEPSSRFNVVELWGGKKALYDCRPRVRYRQTDMPSGNVDISIAASIG